MDTFEEDFRAALLSADVAALIGDRASWSELPGARQRPCMSLWNTTRDRDYNMSGPSGLAHAFVQLDCWAMTALEARQLARKVVDTLSGLQAVVGSTRLQGVFFMGDRDSNEPMAGSPAQRYYRVSLDAEIWFTSSL